MTKNFTFCFDRDAAGLTATRRAVELYLGRDFTVKVVNLPGDAKDPDELIKQDPELFRTAVKTARLFLDHYADIVLPKGTATVEQKKAAAKELLPLVARLTDPIEREHYVRLLSARLGTSTEALESAMKKQPTVKPQPKQPAEQVQVKPVDTGRRNLEMQVLGGVLVNKTIRSQVLAEAEPEDFTDPEVAGMVETLKKTGEVPLEVKSDKLAKESQFMVESLTDELAGNEYAVTRELQKSFALLRLSRLRRQLELIEQSMKSAESGGLQEQLGELRLRFGQLTQARLSYEKQL
jgi:DNA primase